MLVNDRAAALQYLYIIEGSLMALFRLCSRGSCILHLVSTSQLSHCLIAAQQWRSTWVEWVCVLIDIIYSHIFFKRVYIYFQRPLSSSRSPLQSPTGSGVSHHSALTLGTDGVLELSSVCWWLLHTAQLMELKPDMFSSGCSLSTQAGQQTARDTTALSRLNEWVVAHQAFDTEYSLILPCSCSPHIREAKHRIRQENSCTSVTVFHKIKATFLKRQQSTTAICRCWMVWST